MKLIFVSCLVLLAACGLESTETVAVAPAKTRAPLEASFQTAAREYQVPVGVLEAVGWVETRLSSQANLESGSGGVGVMQLARRGDVDTLGEAARLTGVSEGQLRVDARANVRGAAAVLRALFDRTQASNPSLDANQAGDWYEAVSLYPGFSSATLAADYASQVFQQLEQGFEVESREGVIGHGPQTSTWRVHAPLSSVRHDALVQYPGAAAWAASPNFSAGRSTYEFVLIHTMQGSYSGTLSWFQNSASSVSSHYIVRSSDGQVTQMVEDQNTAWHAQCYNARSVGIEHEGFIAAPATWYTDAMYTESAKLTRWLADTHGIPRDRTHIIGHNEVAANCNTNGHTDPGSGWNWTKYMALVNGTTPTGATGVFIGAIYSGGNSANRVAGATVQVGTQSVTTAADGLYQFTLAPGSYTATVTKAGYSTATVTRTVTAAAQIWGSMEINPSAATGTLSGTVYAFNPASPTDQSMVLSGAVVTVPGQTVTTGVNGTFSFTLAPGTVSLKVTKTGYQDNTSTRAVTAGVTTTAAVGLSSGTTADLQPPNLAISFPLNGAALALARIELAGTASDDRGAINTVQVSVNGGAATDVPVTNGTFHVAVQLTPGANTLLVAATDAAGNRGQATSTATYNAGMSGFVVLSTDPATHLEGATVDLREASTGNLVTSVTSDATGAYFAPTTVVPADYLVVVKKSGYLTASQTVTIGADAQLSLDLALTPGVDQPVEASITFTEPKDGARVNTETVTVYGSVSGFDVTGVLMNSVPATLLGGGGFTVTVPLKMGKNTLEAVATGTTGQTVSAQLKLVRTDANGCGGCSSASGELALLALGVALLGRRRRR